MAIPLKFRLRARRDQAATLSRLILECIDDLGEIMLEGFFPAKYPEARIWRTLLGLDENYHFRRETFSTLLSRLRAQGLVERSGGRKQGCWRITAGGREYLRRTSAAR